GGKEPTGVGRKSSLMRALIPLGLVLVAAAGGGKSSSHRAAPRVTTSSTATITTTAATTTNAQVPTTVVRVYFLRDAKVAPVAREVPQTQAAAFASREELFPSPTADARADGPTTPAPPKTPAGARTTLIRPGILSSP